MKIDLSFIEKAGATDQSDSYQMVQGLDGQSATISFTDQNQKVKTLGDNMGYLVTLMSVILIVAIIFRLLRGALLKGTSDVIYDLQDGTKMIKNAGKTLIIFILLYSVLSFINPDLTYWSTIIPKLSKVPATGLNSTGGTCDPLRDKKINDTLSLGGLDSSYSTKKLADIGEVEIKALQSGIKKQEGGSPAGVKNNPGNIKYQSGITSCKDSGVKAQDGGTFISCDTIELYDKVEQDIIKGYISKYPGITVGGAIAKWKGLGDGSCSQSTNNTSSCGNLPESDLSEIAPGIKLKNDSAQKFKNMQSAALKEGIVLTPTSGYRSDDKQKALFDQYGCKVTASGGSGCSGGRLVAVPCQLGGSGSNHERGDAFDLKYSDTQNCTNGNSSGCSSSKIYTWMKTNASSYGFSQSSSVRNSDPIHWSTTGN
jgi:hypothetical protein